LTRLIHTSAFLEQGSGALHLCSATCTEDSTAI